MRRGILFFIILLFTAAVFVSLISCGGLGALMEDRLVFASDGNGGAVLVSVQGYHGKEVTVPEISPDGEPTVGIGAEAFAGSGAVAVTLPEGITFIDGRAFANCTALRSFHLPDSVSELEGRVFEGCEALSVLTVGEGNSSYYSKNNCIIKRDGGVLIAGCGGSVIPEGVEQIASGAFYGSSVSGKVSLPDGVTTIGSYAFYGCDGMAEIALPDSLTDIGAYAFNGCSALTEIAVPTGVTVLNEGVFRNCTAIVTADLPEGLTVIGDMAFQGCVSLVDPVLPESLTKLGGLSFSSCVSFIHLKIPKNLTYIDETAFDYCDMLWGIKVDGENPVFRAVTNCLIRRSDGVIVLGTRGSRIPAEESVTAIADRAFFGATHIRDLTVPANITSIGKEAFYGCSYLEWVIIDGECTVGDNAFAHCFTLNAVYISDGVAEMGRGVFIGCTSLESVLIGAQSVPDGWVSDWNGCGATVQYGCDRPYYEVN